MNADAIAKIRMLKGSIKCLVFGLIGFLPVIGLPFALAALWLSGSVRRQEKKFWNAAKPYRLWGEVCAAISAIFWSGILIFVVGHLVMFADNR
ncbi:MAG TPA: hypothetical protein VHG89_01800 [Verrucomicrobiae bacterium]|nr:hypothetical protein [Verrucomicrobiae bacterium]